MMNTVTLSPEVYHKAETFAQQDQLNVDDWVNKVLLNIVVDYPKKEEPTKEPAATAYYISPEVKALETGFKCPKDLSSDYKEEWSAVLAERYL